MKVLFYFGIAGLILFEIANVYFIMPMPGSQRMESLDLAFAVYQLRWAFRVLFGMLALIGLRPAFRTAPLWTVATLVLAGALGYLFNFKMAAESMFLQPNVMVLTDAKSNKIKPEKLILGVEVNGQARAYPIQLLGYHHQVLDTTAREPLMVTYCTVCRTGRVFSPMVNGKREQFRLVGMDHFNAMFEDESTGSWWRQATGEAVAGPLKGTTLREIQSTQTTLRTWLQLHPNSLIMQGDDSYAVKYDSMDTYDLGIGRGKLTRSDTVSWNEKSWVVGVAFDQKNARAYDWNRLKNERIIHDHVGGKPVLLVLASDNQSFSVLLRPDSSALFSMQNDTLIRGDQRWDLLGRASSAAHGNLVQIPAHQEFWHSWQTFHPFTTRY